MRIVVSTLKMYIPTAEPAAIQRSTYSLGGQPIALRVVEKAANGTELSNELYYYHTDHLGVNSELKSP